MPRKILSQPHPELSFGRFLPSTKELLEFTDHEGTHEGVIHSNRNNYSPNKNIKRNQTQNYLRYESRLYHTSSLKVLRISYQQHTLLHNWLRTTLRILFGGTLPIYCHYELVKDRDLVVKSTITIDWSFWKHWLNRPIID